MKEETLPKENEDQAAHSSEDDEEGGEGVECGENADGKK